MTSTGNHGNNSHISSNNNNPHHNSNDPNHVKKHDLDHAATNVDMITLVEKKIYFFEDIMQKTLLHVQRNKLLDILAISEATSCINNLHDISKKIKEISATLHEVSSDTLINNLQIINNELSSLFKIYGTSTLEDLLWICFGNNYITTVAPSIIISDLDKSKFELLKKYFHPTSYKVINFNCKLKEEKDKKPGKTSTAPTKEDYQLVEQSVNLDCYDISTNTDNFYLKVYGLKMVIVNPTQNKALLISGIMDDINLDLINNLYLKSQLLITETDTETSPDYARFIASLMLKDVLICNSVSLHDKFAGMQSNVKSIKQKTVAAVVKEFIASDLFIKRSTIIQLLINVDNFENQYLAYLLYDLLSNDVNGLVDTQEQTAMFDSFTWNIKSYFRDAMKNTIKYTTELSNFDTGKIPLEQQICLLKANEHVKEKAMQKLKEIKAKSEDTGSKARQYLDGLLKIPFNIYKKEPILLSIQEMCGQFKIIRDTYATLYPNADLTIPYKEKYTSMELIKYTNDIKRISRVGNDKLIAKLAKKPKASLLDAAHNINAFISHHGINMAALPITQQDKPGLLASITAFLNACPAAHIFGLNVLLLDTILEGVPFSAAVATSVSLKMMKDIVHVDEKFLGIRKYLGSVKHTLDEAIHGHDKAKQQIERIICQWINGEQDGHCFGFEGPPGVGKTSLAKYGLSQCLKDEHGISRPFSMIQIGGDSNGSSLHGHNYTYVGSNWGSIVQILMDKKCMNPIIFIDEVDKISKTEQGREIVGILTHMLDTTQNDCFQDKYFSGIDLDLSKTLFILSYNDVDAIDKVLLDRIHRIKFYNLSLEDKLVICKKHILPDIYKKMGLEDIICIEDAVMRFIIEEYTCEPGVRKLKELLFEIVGELNKMVLTTMTSSDDAHGIPITLTKEMIKMNYLKDRNEIICTMVHSEPIVGTINGMYATGGGTGGIIPIQSCFMPGTKFLDLTLTGMQGAVMKESMTVALTLAWSLTTPETQTELKDKYGGKNIQSIHVHCPEGATPKDGPSAGGAITCALYSLLNNKKIRNDVAMTGEISLNGRISAIGGLDLKIYGSIRAGVKTIIYPADNHKDYLNFIEKYEGNEMLHGVTFHKVAHISEVFAVALE
jgi:ATP-dependent Lon protease